MESEEDFTWRNFWVEEEVGRQEFEGRPGGVRRAQPFSGTECKCECKCECKLGSIRVWAESSQPSTTNYRILDHVYGVRSMY
jgi:hypothetical protein